MKRQSGYLYNEKYNFFREAMKMCFAFYESIEKEVNTKISRKHFKLKVHIQTLNFEMFSGSLCINLFSMLII